MARQMQGVQPTPRTDSRAAVERMDEDGAVRPIEHEDQALAVASPADADARPVAGTEQTPAQSVRDFYERTARRPDMRELLARLARK